MSESAVTLGVRLKAERERRGLSAAKAADELHLDGWVIDALEAEDFERVGPSVYAKGHLKRYAGLLGLPVPEILAAYESRVQAPKQAAAQSSTVRMRTDTPDVSNLPWPQILGSFAVLLLVIGVLWWKPWHERGVAPVSVTQPSANSSVAPSDSATDAADAASDSPATASTTSAATASPPASTANATGAAPGAGGSAAVAARLTSNPGLGAPTGSGAAASSALDSTAGAGRARLRLSFSADSWVDVHDAAGHKAFSGKGRANSVKVIHGVAPMRVYLQVASGVQLEINDRAVAIGPQFVAGDVARFEAGADGILRRDSHSTAATGSGAATPGAQSRNTHPTG